MLKNKQLDFVGNKKKFFIISSVLIVIILLWSVIFGVDLDIKFKGGTILSYSYTDTIDVDDVAKTVKDTIGQSAKIATKDSLMGETQSVDITLSSANGLSSDVQAELNTALMEEYKDINLEQLSISSVKPTMGREFFLKCLAAVVFGSIVMVIYIALRFKRISGWSAGVLAVVALIHDIIIIFGTFALTGISINDNFIAVILTILGYSINDTIVIYDRIRENESYYHKTHSTGDIVNMSINQTLRRTINTSLSTIMAMVIICVIASLTGVTSIISFALPMIVGLISGTYSSICVAAPLWVVWQDRKKVKGKK